MSRKSILFISTQLPFPPKSGGTIKSWNYLKDLSNRYEMGLACLLKDDDEQHLESFGRELSFKHTVFQKLDTPRNIVSLLKSYLAHPCLNVYRNYSKSFKDEVEQIASHYDAIIIDHYEVFQYVPKSYRGKVILHTHNAEFELWNRMMDLKMNPLIKIALKIEKERVLRYEKKIIDRSDLVYASPFDIQSFKDQGIGTEHIKETYHLGNDELLKLPELEFDQSEEALLFMGTLSWEPNIDGILWFIKEIFPLIVKEDPDLKLYILGREADDRLSKAASAFPQIELCGFVDDIDSYLNISRIFIAPLRFGSGMKVKVLEGMYRGLPIITTTVGAEGLDVGSDKEIMVADEASAYAAACIDLLSNKTKWEMLSKNSRKKAAEKYTWQPLFDSMDKELHLIL